MSRVLDLIPPAHGQCRLAFTSATAITLQPYNGLNLSINGNLEKLPAAGVAASNSGLSANTTYFVYAYLSAGVVALELSATGHTQASNGVEVKTGDSSRTLVGMVRTNGSSQFQESAAVIGVLSWFNRRRKVGQAKFTANRTMAASVNVFSEVHPEIRVPFLTWGDEPVRQAICGGWTVTGAATATGYAVIDTDNSGQRAWCSHSANTTGTFASVDERLVSEGFHYGTLYGNCASGTNALWLGGQNGEVSQVLTVVG